MKTHKETSPTRLQPVIVMGDKAHIATGETTAPDGEGYVYDAIWLQLDTQQADEPLERQLLEAARQECLRQIAEHDKSDEVNTFFLDGEPQWLDFETRSRLYEGNERLRLAGRTQTTIWLGTDCHTLAIDEAQSLIAQLEAYAKDCNDTTARHLRQAQALGSLQELLAYDITEEYPEKISLTTKKTET